MSRPPMCPAKGGPLSATWNPVGGRLASSISEQGGLRLRGSVTHGENSLQTGSPAFLPAPSEARVGFPGGCLRPQTHCHPAEEEPSVSVTRHRVPGWDSDLSP